MTVADKVLVCSSVNDRGIFFELPAKNTERPKALSVSALKLSHDFFPLQSSKSRQRMRRLLWAKAVHLI